VSPLVHGSLLALETTPINTEHGMFTAHLFHNLTTGAPVLVLAIGDLRAHAPLLARVHSSCITSESYLGCDCDCAEQLTAAMAAIAAAGRGVLFYLTQEGRGAGFTAKARDRMLVQASRDRLSTFDAYAQMGLRHDQRRYGEVAAASQLLGIEGALLLLSNNPDKAAALRAEGVEIAGVVQLPSTPSPFNLPYLAAKSRAGHALAELAGEVAHLPEPVVAFEPHAVAELPRFIRTASYLLPVRVRRPAWFRVHVYLDTATGTDRVVLTHGPADRGAAVVSRVQRETLLERFPLRRPRFKRRWREAVVRITAVGAGATLFLGDRDAAPDPATLTLLTRHAANTTPELDA